MMHWKPALVDLWEALRHLAEPLLPGAFGAAVGQMWEHGLSWRDRLAQWFIGLSFAVFLVPGIGHVFGWGDPLVNAVGFVVGTLAFKAYVPLREAFIAGATGGLKMFLTNLGSWMPSRRSAPPPTTPEGEG